MSMMAALLGGAVLAGAAPAPGEGVSAEQILRRNDEVERTHQDQTLILSIRSGPIGGRTQKQKLHVVEKGKWRLMRFLEPASAKGMAVLILDRNTMYVYLPAFNKVRRIAAHTRGQTFQGSDFTYDDMTVTHFADDYLPTIEGEDADHYLLKLTPRPGSDVDFGWLKMWVSKRQERFEKLEYYDKDGTLLRTQTRGSYRVFGPGPPTPVNITMTDHRRHHRTTITIEDVKVDRGVPDSFFTVRELSRGR